MPNKARHINRLPVPSRKLIEIRASDDDFNARSRQAVTALERSVAWAVAKETSVPHAWIAERLNLKSAANASQQIRRFHKGPEKELPKEVRSRKLSKNAA